MKDQAGWYSVTAMIAGERVFVGGYKVRKPEEAQRAAQDDLLALIPLTVTAGPGDVETLPNLVQMQLLTPDDLLPIEF